MLYSPAQLCGRRRCLPTRNCDSRETSLSSFAPASLFDNCLGLRFFRQQLCLETVKLVLAQPAAQVQAQPAL